MHVVERRNHVCPLKNLCETFFVVRRSRVHSLTELVNETSMKKFCFHSLQMPPQSRVCSLCTHRLSLEREMMVSQNLICMCKILDSSEGNSRTFQIHTECVYETLFRVAMLNEKCATFMSNGAHSTINSTDDGDQAKKK